MGKGGLSHEISPNETMPSNPVSHASPSVLSGYTDRLIMRFRFALYLACMAGLSFSVALGAESVRYNRDVRPILADKCFRCHGPDAASRKGKLRLDRRDDAIAERGGVRVISPGDSNGSELVRRIMHTDPDERMPPVDSSSSLSPKEIATLCKWIDQGAAYEDHWSLTAPTSPSSPKVRNKDWIRNDIDAFVLSRLEGEDVGEPAPEASKETLIRRLSLDLTGLPPTLDEIDAFLADDAPGVYERLVDRLLRSPRFGERMAGPWLDAARFADSNGYFTDLERTMWPWREWVVRAFNDNMPFDQFTIEQLAGDLLPKATLSQKIATGFNRNHMVNNETGIIADEYRVEYVADRVKTTSTVWLGLTLECARCHDHKYDPISQEEYYRFFAFFNNVPEKGLDGGRGNAAPVLNVATAKQQAGLKLLEQKVRLAEQAFKPIDAELHKAQAQWEKSCLTGLAGPPETGLIAHFEFEKDLADSVRDKRKGTKRGSVDFKPGYLGGAVNVSAGSAVEVDAQLPLGEGQAFSAGAWIYSSGGGTACVVSKIDDAHDLRGFDMVIRKGKALVHLVHQWRGNAIEVATVDSVAGRQWQHLMFTYDGSSRAAGVAIYLNGVRQALEIRRDALTDSFATDEPLRFGRRQASASFQGRIDDARIYNRALSGGEVESLASGQFLRGALATPTGKRDKVVTQKLRKRFIDHHASARQREAVAELARLKREVADYQAMLPVMMVMAEEKKPRTSFILDRGEYNKRGRPVTSGVPASLPSMRDGLPSNRLGLAQWLVAPENPLTARVIVNRFWSQFFGRGIVVTSDDFGSQGDWPEHPELLDWLACEFRDNGWDVKELVKLIVSSATYRQSSRSDPERIARDPENRLLARGPRFRMEAETIRDNALFVSGLLAEKIGGPSVKPYQPDGLWREMTYDGGLSYKPDRGDSLYRRSLYTYWKRQSPPPNMLLFDAPTRETCTVTRPRTNTPLQALALMNDPTFVEAARHLAGRMMREAGAKPAGRIQRGFRIATGRRPSAEELGVLRRIHDEQLLVYRADQQAALDLLSVGSSPVDASLDAGELATLTTVANLILSLDETITKL
jgi:hypothetical protein